MDTTTIPNSQSVAFNCLNCGAELTFDPDKQMLCCEFCESEFTQEEISAANAHDISENKIKSGIEFCENFNEYTCPNCGAETACDEATISHTCVYCHSPVILKGKLSGQMMPDKIVPFKFSKDEAKAKFMQFAKKKMFVPNEFKSEKHASLITGVYFPFWVTDADTNGDMQADATKVKVWRVGDTQYTETSKFKIQRNGFIHFEDIVSSALNDPEKEISDCDKEILEGILPFPSDSLEKFAMPYLSGFSAKKRNIERETLSDEVKKRINDYAKTLLSRTVSGYATVTPTKVNVKIHKSTWEYALMPVWMLNYVTPKKTYKYAMNGYTGKIYGEFPLSIPKLLALSGAVFAAVTPIIALIGGLFL